MRHRLLLVLAGLLSGCSEPFPVARAAAPGVTYALDPAKSALYVQVFKDPTTVGSDLSHDHVVLATGWSGTVRLDPTNPATCEARVSVPISGLRPDLPEWRRRVGYNVMLSDAQQTQVGEHLRGGDQLDASRFPEIHFQSNTCAGSGESRTASGTLAIRGVSKAVQVPLKLTVKGGTLKASGGFSLKHSDFGFQPYTAFFGALKNQEELRFTIDVVGAASP